MPDRGSSRPAGRWGGGGLPGHRLSRSLLRVGVPALVLFAALTIGADLWTGSLWYRSIGFSSVYSTRLTTQALLFAGFGAVLAGMTGVNAWLAYRLRPAPAGWSLEQLSVQRYRDLVDGRGISVLLLVAGLPGLLGGLAAAAAWQTFLGWAHATSFGELDPQFHQDLSFYVFRLPWYRFVVDYGFLTLVLSLLVSATAHHLFGGLRAQSGGGARCSGAARAHLAVLLALFLALKAVSYWLDRYELAVQPSTFRGSDTWTGFRYVDANGVLPGKTVLCGVAAICTLLFLLTPVLRSWLLPVTGLGLLALSSVLVGTVYPAFVQELQVRPDEKASEAAFVERGISATRAAYGIAGTRTTDFVAGPAAAPADLRLQLPPAPAGTGGAAGPGADGTPAQAGSDRQGSSGGVSSEGTGSAAYSLVDDASSAGGVSLSGRFTRLAYALKFGAPTLLFPTAPDADPRIQYDLDPLQRVQAVAPWLTPDGDPYRITLDHRAVWVVDGYTTSDDYPDAARGTLGAAGPEVNYVRNAVKATVDAGTGAVTLYQWDAQDPVLRTWMKAFPGTVRPRAAISPALLAQLRYPEDLFSLQRQVLTRYHVTDPGTFYDGGDAWTVPADPTGGAGQAQPPAYVSAPLPGEPAGASSLTGVLVRARGGGLAAYLAVDSTPGPGYGRLNLLRMPTAPAAPGPAQVQAALTADPAVMPQLAQWQRDGETVQYGGQLTLPVGAGMLTVEPLYVRGPGTDTDTAVPPLVRVVASYGDRTVLADDLPTALAGVLGARSGLAADLRIAQQAVQDGQTALRHGDTAGYQQAQARLSAALSAAAAAAKGP
ncbi:UPF0182 family protein [Streptacidiphilus sp. EB129]|uniref:UPF0182 family protein n=1 Tax=Streptacidiphilus sp. EB129 TaxID=3156262 RepID=UPI003515D6E7